MSLTEQDLIKLQAEVQAIREREARERAEAEEAE